jgi:hypothetical protein
MHQLLRLCWREWQVVGWLWIMNRLRKTESGVVWHNSVSGIDTTWKFRDMRSPGEIRTEYLTNTAEIARPILVSCVSKLDFTEERIRKTGKPWKRIILADLSSTIMGTWALCFVLFHLLNRQMVCSEIQRQEPWNRFYRAFHFDRAMSLVLQHTFLPVIGWGLSEYVIHSVV